MYRMAVEPLGCFPPFSTTILRASLSNFSSFVTGHSCIQIRQPNTGNANWLEAVTRLWSDRGLDQMIDMLRRNSLAAHSKDIFSSFFAVSKTPKNLYGLPSSRSEIQIFSSTVSPEASWLWVCTRLCTWTTAHFLGFHWSLTSSIALLVDSITRFSLLSEDAKISRSSIYRRSVTFTLIGLDRL